MFGEGQVGGTNEAADAAADAAAEAERDGPERDGQFDYSAYDGSQSTTQSQDQLSPGEDELNQAALAREADQTYDAAEKAIRERQAETDERISRMGGPSWGEQNKFGVSQHDLAKASEFSKQHIYGPIKGAMTDPVNQYGTGLTDQDYKSLQENYSEKALEEAFGWKGGKPARDLLGNRRASQRIGAFGRTQAQQDLARDINDGFRNEDGSLTTTGMINRAMRMGIMSFMGPMGLIARGLDYSLDSYGMNYGRNRTATQAYIDRITGRDQAMLGRGERDPIPTKPPPNTTTTVAPAY